MMSWPEGNFGGNGAATIARRGIALHPEWPLTHLPRVVRSEERRAQLAQGVQRPEDIKYTKAGPVWKMRRQGVITVWHQSSTSLTVLFCFAAGC